MDHPSPEPHDSAHDVEEANATLPERTRAVRGSEGRATEILESITDGFFAIGRDWRFTYVNREAERLLRRTREDLLGKVLWSEFPNIVGSLFEEQYRRAMEERSTVRFETYYEPLAIWVSVRAYPSADGLSIYFVDVTEHRRAEEALRESEQKLRLIADNIREIFWMFDRDFSRTIYINRAYEAIWGRPLESVYRDPRSFLNGVHPEDLPALKAALYQVHAGTLEGVDYRIIRPDGEIRWVRSQGYPIHDETGEVRAVVGTTEDITGRKRAESRLAAAEAHYRRLVQNAPYGVYALDLEGRFIELNPAAERLAGRPAEEALGQHFSTVIAPVDLDVATRGFETVVSGEADHIEFDERIVRPSGEERLIRVTESAIRENGTIIGTHGIARDITEDAEREKSLRRAERLASVGTLVAGVAHELNNPLHAIRNFADLVLMADVDPDDRESLEIIREEADRAAAVVANLRQIARETQDTGESRMEFDLNEIVRHALRIRNYSLATANIEVRQELAADLPPVRVNRSDIEQVVLNLLVNSEQAMSAASGPRRLVIRTRRAATGATIDIADTGPGIPAGELERIFDPFFTTKDPGVGTGLGLSLVHKITTEHGGRVQVESEPGTGTTFRVFLPCASGTAESSRQAAAPPGGRQALKILVVDDEPAIRRVSVRLLERMGHRVDAAAEGGEALRMAREIEYDVILSDLRMPGLGGEDFLQKLQEDGKHLRTHLILITGDAASARAAGLTFSNRVPVLLKPLRLEELARAIESISRQGESGLG